MIAVIRIAPFGVFYYWQKSVTGGLGRSSQNDGFIAAINFQERSALALESYRNWQRNKNGRLITDGHTTAAIQIPIVSRHTEISYLRPAVSSLGACPTPAP
jgi:hypothetical protein